MNLLNCLFLLLAQADSADAVNSDSPFSRISTMPENLTSKDLISLHWLLILAGVMLLLLSGVSAFQWWKHRNEHSRPWMIYFTAARIAGLNYTQQWILFWIARRQSLASPLTLMLSPDTFDYHVKAYLATCANWWREPLRNRLEVIREMLFSGLDLETFEAQIVQQAT